MPLVATLHEKPLAAFGRYSPGAKGGGVWTDVKRAMRRKNGSTYEGVLDCALELPVGNVYGDRVGIQKLDKFLILVSGTGAGLDVTEVDDGLAGRRAGKRPPVELRQDEHPRTREAVVQALNCENITARHEIAFFGGYIIDVERRQIGDMLLLRGRVPLG